VLSCTMDPRFCSLVSWVTVEIEQDTVANAAVGFALNDTALRHPPQRDQGTVVAVAAAINNPSIAKTWAPVPMVLAGGPGLASITVRGLNLDSDQYFLSALIYLFDISVREKTPMGPLLWSRGAT